MKTGSRLSIVPARAYDDSRLDDRAIVVLGIIGTYADRDGWCYPAQGTMGARLGVTRQAVSRQVAKLVETGYLEKTRRADPKTGSETSCQYRVKYDDDLPEEFDRLQTLQHTGCTPCNIQVAQTSQKNEEKKTLSLEVAVNSNWLLAEALSEVCILDLPSNKGRLLKAAKALEGKDPAEMRSLLGDDGVWYRYDWRGKKGSPPSIGQVSSEWKKMELFLSMIPQVVTAPDGGLYI